MPTPCGISDLKDRLMSYVETEANAEICANIVKNLRACIIRQLSETKVIVRCLWCNIEFETYFCKIKAGRGKFCGRSCLGNFNGALRNIDKKGITSHNNSKKGNGNWQGGKLVPCDTCGKLFWKYPSRKQKTCSVECGYDRAIRVKQGKLKGTGHSKTYGGKKHWEKIRNSILERDNYTCQNCNLYSTENISILHVHYKIRIVDGGSHEQDNLITLCYKCHHKIHKDDRLR